MPLLLFFLLATLGLSLWLGFQALSAARSHRRTAEGVLRDYGEMAAWEYSRLTQERLGSFLWELFDDVPRRVRRGSPPPPDVVAGDLPGALRQIGCSCPRLRAEGFFLRVDLQSGDVESLPDTVPVAVSRQAAEVAREAWGAAPADRIALVVAGAREVLEPPSVLAFNVSLDSSGQEGEGRAIYAFLAPLGAWAELLLNGLERTSLLPEAVAGARPEETLLDIALYTPGGEPVFRSSGESSEALMVRDTLPARYGGWIVEVGVRPDAADALVIGGLPRTRLPLLVALMLMTLAVGGAALVQVRKEEEWARLREDFISGVSHEFRTPLTQIRMFTELMADGKLRSSDEWDRSVSVINREARRLTHLVENILHFSPAEKRPLLPRSPERVMALEAIGDLLEAFGPLVEERRVRVEVSVEPPGAVALASRGEFHQMLANLLDNALKYGPEGRTVRIEGRVRDGRMRVAVEDQGPGIPPADRQRIWRPYRRLTRDVEGREKGSGIGLSVVKRLAETWGGRAWVEDGGAGGSRFVVELPGREEEA
jgi:signal transduction histidine kinase